MSNHNEIMPIRSDGEILLANLELLLPPPGNGKRYVIKSVSHTKKGLVVRYGIEDVPNGTTTDTGITSGTRSDSYWRR